jgi:hypothetical protein
MMKKTQKQVVDVATISVELQKLQRQRSVYLKSRIMITNRLQAIVAGTMDYHSGMTLAERAKLMKKAATLIKKIENGEVESELSGLVKAHLLSVEEFVREQKRLDKAMVALAEQLPVAKWVESPEQKCFGLLSLAIVVGETGDLFKYANPAKVWRRLGCAPFTKGDETLMGATWKGRKKNVHVEKLTKDEWSDFGYSPRRRSIAYLIGEGIVKQNGCIKNGNGTMGVNDVKFVNDKDDVCIGPYRSRYDETKKLLAEKHPDYSKQRCHLHGMLLATKLLLKNLWIEWNGHPAMPTLEPIQPVRKKLSTRSKL